MLSNRKGFTLIELLIVVVIIGILAAIAIPKFANTKEKAYVSAMKSDLRNLATAQETYFGDYQVYATADNTGLYDKAGNKIWQTSTGVYIVSGGNTTGNSSGWAGLTTRPGTTQQCSIWVGGGGSGAAKWGTSQSEGEPTCYAP
jgi:prepilin-type N-terminal cleavage/methylation domain-containing protein